MTIEKATREELTGLIQKHSKLVLAPMDDMWEQMIIPSGAHYKMVDNEITVGYFIIDVNNNLLQIFAIDDYKWHLPTIFEYLLEEFNVKGALAGTYEPEFLSFCLDRCINFEIDTILYQAVPSTELTCPIEDVVREIASMENYDEILTFCHEKVGLEGEWMEPYYQNLLPQAAIHIFRKEGVIIGVGELRKSHSSPAFANLGIMVSKDWRKKQLGSYIMNYMKFTAKRKGLFGICSTTIDNVASQKAITKAGLMPYHRILKIQF